MPETPDLKALAERYLDLWEEQFAAAAADPALAAAMATWLGPWRALARGATPGGGDAGKAEDGRGATSPARSAAAAAPSHDGGRGLERIVERLDHIERRLDALERKRERKGGAARAGTGRGRTGGAE